MATRPNPYADLLSDLGSPSAPATPSRPRASSYDDLLSDLGQPREEESLFEKYATPALGVRLGAPILGGMAGAALGTAIAPGPGTAIGAALGAGLAGAGGEIGGQVLDEQPIDYGEAALAGGLSMIPAGPAARAIKPGMGLLARAGLHTLEGVGQGALDAVGTSLYRRGELPTGEELASGGIAGAVLGGALGLGGEAVGRAFRPDIPAVEAVNAAKVIPTATVNPRPVPDLDFVDDVSDLVPEPSLDLRLSPRAQTAQPAAQEPLGATITPSQPIGTQNAQPVAPGPIPVDRRTGSGRDELEAILSGLPAEQQAILRAQMRQLESQADTDPLTGLLGNRAWQAQQGQARPGRTVVAADLKGFKAINDSVGHKNADEGLKAVAQVWAKHFGQDKAFRPMGDEFYGFLDDVPEAEIPARLAAIQREVGQLTVQVQLPDGSVVALPQFNLHIGAGQNAEAADLAANAARAQYGSGRPEVQGEPQPQPAAPRGAEGGGQDSPQQLKTYRGQTGSRFDPSIESGRYPGLVFSAEDPAVAGIYAEGPSGFIEERSFSPGRTLDLTSRGALVGPQAFADAVSEELGQRIGLDSDIAPALRAAGYQSVKFTESVPGRHGPSPVWVEVRSAGVAGDPQQLTPSFQDWSRGRLPPGDVAVYRALREEYLRTFPQADREQFRPQASGPRMKAFEGPASNAMTPEEVAQSAAEFDARVKTLVPDEVVDKDLREVVRPAFAAPINRAMGGSIKPELGLEHIDADRKTITKAIDVDGDNPLYLQIKEARRLELADKAMEFEGKGEAYEPQGIVDSSFDPSEFEAPGPVKYSVKDAGPTKEAYLFQPRKQRLGRFGKYGGKPAEVLYEHPDGKRLVMVDGERFSVYPDELVALAKPLHGSPQNFSFNNDGTLRRPGEPKFAVRPSPGQQGLAGIGEDVPQRQEQQKKAPQQASMFGGQMLQGVESRTTEGREGDGPLFAKDEKPRETQAAMFDGDPDATGNSAPHVDRGGGGRSPVGGLWVGGSLDDPRYYKGGRFLPMEGPRKMENEGKKAAERLDPSKNLREIAITSFQEGPKTLYFVDGYYAGESRKFWIRKPHFNSLAEAESFARGVLEARAASRHPTRLTVDGKEVSAPKFAVRDNASMSPKGGPGRDSGVPANPDEPSPPPRGDSDPSPKFATAFHGSPHDFDAFDSSKIGTGEGAQAYGHGLYFAGKREIAEHYKRVLSSRRGGVAPGTANLKFGNRDQVAGIMEEEIAKVFGPSNSSRAHNYVGGLYEQLYGVGNRADLERKLENLGPLDALIAKDRTANEALRKAQDDGDNSAISREAGLLADYEERMQEIVAYRGALRLLDEGLLELPKPGRLYEVDLSPSEDEYLLWDRPLSEQSEKVRAALAKVGVKADPAIISEADAQMKDAWDRYQSARKQFGPKDERTVAAEGDWDKARRDWDTLQQVNHKAGKDIYYDLGYNGNERASQILREAGIPGIKYLDGSSRIDPEISRSSDGKSWGVLYNSGPGKRSVREFATKKEAQAFRDELAAKQSYNYVLFDDKLVKVKAKYRQTESPEPKPFKGWMEMADRKLKEQDKPKVDAQTVKRAFPSGNVREGKDGLIHVALPNGAKIVVKRGVEIAPDKDILRKDHPDSVDAEGNLLPGMGIAGAFQPLGRDGIIALAKQGGDEFTLRHESFHAAMHMALSKKEIAAVLKKYGDEETASDAYAAWTPKTPNSWFSKILATFQRIYRAFKPSWESAFERTASGEAFGKRAEVPSAPKFATRKDEPSFPPGSPEREENFRKWFGESKVVDDEGNPLIVYHGGPKNVDTFDLDSIQRGVGFHFGAEEHAALYGKPQAAHLSIRRPYEGDILETDELVRMSAGERRRWRDEKIAQGFDGAIFYGSSDTEYVAFRPEQIKGVNNRGTFDPKNPNIKFATAPKFEPTPEPRPKSEMGRPMRPDEAHRVDAKVEDLKSVDPDVHLSRDAPRTWESLDKNIRKKLGDVLETPEKEAAFYKKVQSGKIDDVEVQTLDALVAGKKEAYESIRHDLLKAQMEGRDTGPGNIRYLQAALDQVTTELAQAARSDVEAGTKLARALAARARVMKAAGPDSPDVEYAFRRATKIIHDMIDNNWAQVIKTMKDSGDLRVECD